MKATSMDFYLDLVQPLSPIVEAGLFEVGLWEGHSQSSTRPSISADHRYGGKLNDFCLSRNITLTDHDISDVNLRSTSVSSLSKANLHRVSGKCKKETKLKLKAFLNLEFRVVMDNLCATPTLNFVTERSSTMDDIMDMLLTWCAPQCYNMFKTRRTSSKECLHRDMYLLCQETSPQKNIVRWRSIWRGDEGNFASYLEKNIAPSNDRLKFEIHFAMGGTKDEAETAWRCEDMTTWAGEEAFECAKMPGYVWRIDGIGHMPRLEEMTEDQKRELEDKVSMSQPSTQSWFACRDLVEW